MSDDSQSHPSRACPVCGQLTDDDSCPRDRTATLPLRPVGQLRTRLAAGTLIGGRYEVRRLIGSGGHGAVYEARHTGTGQGVALKVLLHAADSERSEVETPEAGPRPPTALLRFFQEARLMAGLQHPNTVRVFDFGQDESGLVYLAMELLTGQTLRQSLKQRRRDGRVFSHAEAIDVGVAITRSLGEAHRAGLVHRDLKPANIFLSALTSEDAPIPRVLDFGIAKQQDSPLTLPGTVCPGTPAYMSPEQVRNIDIDGRSDLYSLGVILFQLVSGRKPFTGASMIDVLDAHVRAPLPDLRALTKTPISEAFVRVVERALQKRPDDRFETAVDMRNALVAAADQPLLVVERPSSRPVIALVFAIALTLACLVTVLMVRSRRNDDATTVATPAASIDAPAPASGVRPTQRTESIQRTEPIQRTERTEPTQRTEGAKEPAIETDAGAAPHEEPATEPARRRRRRPPRAPHPVLDRRI